MPWEALRQPRSGFAVAVSVRPRDVRVRLHFNTDVLCSSISFNLPKSLECHKSLERILLLIQKSTLHFIPTSPACIRSLLINLGQVRL